jgi:hypothetical protein
MKAKRTRLAASQIGTSDEEQLAGFIDKFDSGNAFLIRSVRKTLRRRMPTANELVYDNHTTRHSSTDGCAHSTLASRRSCSGY